MAKPKSDLCTVAWVGQWEDVYPKDKLASKCLICGEVFTVTGLIKHIPECWKVTFA